VFGAIQRFSEDIDLQIAPETLGVDEADLWAADTSVTQRRKRSRALEKKCIEYVIDRLQPALELAITEILGRPKDAGVWLRYEFDDTSKSPVLWFDYPSALPPAFPYVPKAIKLEPGSLADQQPTGVHTIAPLVAEIAGASAFDDFQTDVVAMELDRTFWEKATILHAENHRPHEKPLPPRLARHYYDFARLWRHSEQRRLSSDLALLDKVIRHKSTFFDSAWADYANARPPTLMLVPPNSRVRELSVDYQQMQSMLFGDRPSFDDVIGILREAEAEINGT
jgi:hypothetical protein